jgi:ATP-dependent Clp protease ATP-binding subunit ClpC
VGTEHILLALLAEGDGTAAVLLTSSGATYEHVRAAVVRMMGVGVDPDPGGGSSEPTFTGRAQDTIELAQRYASRRGQELVGTEDVLLALVDDRHGAAVRILQQLDVDPAAIRSALSS